MAGIEDILSEGIGYGSGFCDGLGFGTVSGSGYGDGSGYGYGSRSGCGFYRDYGLGCGGSYDSGSGDRSNNGHGFGCGDGVQSFCGRKVYRIDETQTILTVIHDNYAKGFMICDDLSLKPCYVVKQGDYSAHGETLREAYDAVSKKVMERMSEEERIEAFWECHNRNDKYPAKDFYEWHHKLTGSCKMGRNEFARERGIDLDSDMMTVEEFIKLTENAYGGEIIRKLK